MPNKRKSNTHWIDLGFQLEEYTSMRGFGYHCDQLSTNESIQPLYWLTKRSVKKEREYVFTKNQKVNCWESQVPTIQRRHNCYTCLVEKCLFPELLFILLWLLWPKSSSRTEWFPEFNIKYKDHCLWLPSGRMLEIPEHRTCLPSTFLLTWLWSINRSRSFRRFQSS